MLIALSIMYAVLVVLNLLDGFSTWKVVKPAHLSRELNPLARWMFSKLGIVRGIILAEILWIGVISAVFFRLLTRPVWNVALLVLLGLGVLIFTYVVRGNFVAWRSIRKREDQLASHTKNEEKDVKLT